MKKWIRTDRMIYVLTAAVIPLCILVFAAAAGTDAGWWKYQIQQTVIRYSGEMYMPALVYAGQEKETGIGAWTRQKALSWLPLIRYVEDNIPYSGSAEDEETIARILESQANDENIVDENGNLIGEPDVSEKEAESADSGSAVSMDKLKDFDYLVSHFYIVDSSTMIGPEQLDAERLLRMDMKIDTEKEGPKVLIYHTHSQEEFKDSTPGKTSESIVGVGEYLTELLNKKGINTIHDTGIYDIINGKLDRSNAYGKAEEAVSNILKKNPTIEVVIDLHRDGVASDTHLVTNINGKQTAKIMFFNGLSRSRTNGDIEYLKNPYIEDNLAFSLQMKLACEDKYPGFTRNIYLRAYRYNLHLMPKSLLIEAGAQTNTVEEMMNAMEVLSDVLSRVIT